MGAYLTRDDNITAIDDGGRDPETWKRDRWTGGARDVLWLEEIDHGEIFNNSNNCRALVDIASNYCRGESIPVRRRGVDIALPDNVYRDSFMDNDVADFLFKFLAEPQDERPLRGYINKMRYACLLRCSPFYY